MFLFVYFKDKDLLYCYCNLNVFLSFFLIKRHDEENIEYNLSYFGWIINVLEPLLFILLILKILKRYSLCYNNLHLKTTLNIYHYTSIPHLNSQLLH